MCYGPECERLQIRRPAQRANGAHAERPSYSIEAHARKNWAEAEGWLDGDIQMNLPELLVHVSVFVHPLQHHVSLSIGEMQPGDFLCLTQHLCCDFLRFLFLQFGPQHAWQK